MAVFISYSRADSHFVDTLASNLVLRRHNIWLDRWELSIGDSLIDRIQTALTASSAMLVVLSRTSVQSEWCKKELYSGLTREFAQKQVIVMPCVVDDCEIPLFLRDKLYADFRHNPDAAFRQIDDALLKITNLQQGRLEDPETFTDWSYDWKRGQVTGLWYFEWLLVDHGPSIEYCILNRCQLACNEIASALFEQLDSGERQRYIYRAFAKTVAQISAMKFKFRLGDAFEQFKHLTIEGIEAEEWLVELSSRRMGSDNGKDTLVHIDQVLERALAQTRERMASD